MRIKSLIISVAAVAAICSPALAADVATYADVPPASVPAGFSWDGAYFGALAGYGTGKAHVGDADNGYLRMRPDGFLGGVYAGYNFTVGSNFVLGVDGDIAYNGHHDTLHLEDTDLGLTSSVKNRLGWSGAVRAKAGVAFDRFMPYVAGGLAAGSVKLTGHLSDGVDTVGVSKSHNMVGWTIGGGVDFAATDRLILRTEYRHTDYGKKSFEAVNAEGVEINADLSKMRTNDFRVGIALKF